MLLTRPAFPTAVMFMFGALAARAYPCVSGLSWVGLLAVLFPAAAFLFPKKRRATPAPESLPAGYAPHIAPQAGWVARRGARLFMLALAAAALFLGAYRQTSWRAVLDAGRGRLPTGFFDAVLVAHGPMRDHGGQSGRWRIVASVLSVNDEPVGETRVRLSGPAGPDFRRGDLLRARVLRDAPRPTAFPGAFDLESWMERDGAAVSLLAVRSSARDKKRPAYEVVPVSSPPATTRALRVIDAARTAAIERTLRFGGESAGGMLAAMLFGYRGEMDSAARDAFRRVGIGHVLAISGLHVMLVVGLVWSAGGWLGLSTRFRSAASLFAAALYLGMSGGQTAAARATAMAFLHLGGLLLGRRSDMLNSLAAAALLITAVNPSAPADVSFQLSFTAVLFIHLAVRNGRHGRKSAERDAAMPRARRLARMFAAVRRETAALAWIGVATWIGLFPIVMKVFHQVNPIGLVLNILVIPWMSLVLACGLLLPCLGWVPGLAALLTAPVRMLHLAANGADMIPWSSFPAHAPKDAWIAVFYLSVGTILLLPPARGDASRARRAGRALGRGGALAGMLGIVLSAGSSPPPPFGRIGVLPAFSKDAMALEAPSGEVTLVGDISRDGLREANWLHCLRRGGPVVVVATAGGGDGRSYSALKYHHGIAAIIDMTEEKEDGSPLFRSGVWTDVPGGGGVRVAVGRDLRGKIIWTAAECAGRGVTVAGTVTEGQLIWRFQQNFAGSSPNLILFSRRGRAAPSDLLIDLLGDTPVGARGSPEWPLPRRWFPRDRYGALVLTGQSDETLGYDGERWVALD